MTVNKRLIEKKVWETTAPFLDLPPTSVNGKVSKEGKRQYIAARRTIQELINDPDFVHRFQERQVSMRELLTKSFPPEVFPKLFKTDLRALAPVEDSKQKR